MGWLSGAYMTVEDPRSTQITPRETEQLPPPPRDPRALEYERKWRERQQAYRDRFNARQQKRYEKWLKKRKAAG